MKRKMKITGWLAVFALFVVFLHSFDSTEIYQAASSYTNAKEFYESTARNGENYHAEAANGRVYYATKAKLASSSTNTRYYTVGFDVTLSGNGHSVSFTVQRQGGSMTQAGESVKNGNYEYNLYMITEDKLFELATKADSTNAAYVLGASTINVRMDAIMTTISPGSTTPNGGITENGYGGFTKWGTIYRLRESAALKEMKQIFSGHLFESYTDIKAYIENYLLNVRYAVNGTPTVSANSSTKVTVGSGYRLANRTIGGATIPYVLHNSNGSVYTSSGRTLNKITLLNPAAAGLAKTGYYLPDGKEWITGGNISFAGNEAYQSTDISASVGYEDTNITLYANWHPNTYTVAYDANGGDGSIFPMNMTYDTASALANNTFTRRGYYLPAGKEWVDASGNTWQNGQTVSNLTAENDGTVMLLANWNPGIYAITLDNQNAETAGTAAYYEKYDSGNYTDSGCSAAISKITVPVKTGYAFMGYYTERGGNGTCYIDSSGKILSTASTFDSDTTLYAYWKVNAYTVKYHANGGTGMMSDTSAVYDKSFSLRANAFLRTGYMFKGWADASDGEAVYTDKQYVSNLTSVNGATVDLHAVWEPLLVYITMDKQGGSEGTDDFYEKYENGFYSDKECRNVISKIISPGRTGYTFLGYFERMGSLGEHLINPSGEFLVGNTHFLQDTSIYADWEANKYMLTFDKQGGELGTDSVEVTYDSILPDADAPVKSGYTFKGYYTKTNGGGTMYYNENMASDIVYKLTEDSTVYAYWVDETPPVVTLRATSNTWTKSVITLTADASDLGTGLASVVIYVLDADGNAVEVKSDTSLNGAKSAVLSYDNPTEGIVRYKAVATDVAGLTSESYCTVFYDKTPPKGRVKEFNLDIKAVYFDIDVTDINAK